MLPREQFNKFYYFHYYPGPIFLSVRCVFALSLRRPTCALGATMPPSHGQSADLARNWSDFDCRLAHSTAKRKTKKGKENAAPRRKLCTQNIAAASLPLCHAFRNWVSAGTPDCLQKQKMGKNNCQRKRKRDGEGEKKNKPRTPRNSNNRSSKKAPPKAYSRRMMIEKNPSARKISARFSFTFAFIFLRSRGLRFFFLGALRRATITFWPRFGKPHLYEGGKGAWLYRAVCKTTVVQRL